MKIISNKGTFGFITKKRIYVLQFSLKEPWLIPHCDRNYGEDKSITLYGWLFLYFGYVH